MGCIWGVRGVCVGCAGVWGGAWDGERAVWTGRLVQVCSSNAHGLRSTSPGLNETERKQPHYSTLTRTAPNVQASPRHVYHDRRPTPVRYASLRRGLFTPQLLTHPEMRIGLHFSASRLGGGGRHPNLRIPTSPSQPSYCNLPTVVVNTWPPPSLPQLLSRAAYQ